LVGAIDGKKQSCAVRGLRFYNPTIEINGSLAPAADLPAHSLKCGGRREREPVGRAPTCCQVAGYLIRDTAGWDFFSEIACAAVQPFYRGGTAAFLRAEFQSAQIFAEKRPKSGVFPSFQTAENVLK